MDDLLKHKKSDEILSNLYSCYIYIAADIWQKYSKYSRIQFVYASVFWYYCVQLYEYDFAYSKLECRRVEASNLLET